MEQNKTTQTQQTTTTHLFDFDYNGKIKALRQGYNLDKLAAFIDGICSKFTDHERPNCVEISGAYIWLYVHDAESGQYKDMQYKYNDYKGWALVKGLKEKTNKKRLLNLLNCAASSESFKKSNKPQNNYFIKELENNKPLTLLKAKNENFICFVVFGEYEKINEIDINENKKAFEKDFFDISNNYWNAETIRKQALQVFAIYNKQMPQYKELCKTIATKKAKRQDNARNTDKAQKRYYYTDKSFLNDLLCSTNNLHLYNSFSHNSLSRHEFDTCAAGLEISLGGVTFLKTTEPMTRQQVFNYCVDRSGFCVLFYRERMLRRLRTLKAERQRAREEQRRNEFINSDKTFYKNSIQTQINANKNALCKMLIYDKIMTAGAITLLKTLKDNIKELESIQNDLNKYARYNDPAKEIENDILKYHERYLIAITKYNTCELDWCNADCYQIKQGEIIAKYDWMGQGIHAGEVVKMSINLNGF